MPYIGSYLGVTPLWLDLMCPSGWNWYFTKYSRGSFFFPLPSAHLWTEEVWRFLYFLAVYLKGQRRRKALNCTLSVELFNRHLDNAASVFALLSAIIYEMCGMQTVENCSETFRQYQFVFLFYFGKFISYTQNGKISSFIFPSANSSRDRKLHEHSFNTTVKFSNITTTVMMNNYFWAHIFNTTLW